MVKDNGLGTSAEGAKGGKEEGEETTVANGKSLIDDAGIGNSKNTAQDRLQVEIKPREDPGQSHNARLKHCGLIVLGRHGGLSKGEHGDKRPTGPKNSRDTKKRELTKDGEENLDVIRGPALQGKEGLAQSRPGVRGGLNVANGRQEIAWEEQNPTRACWTVKNWGNGAMWLGFRLGVLEMNEVVRAKMS